MEEIRVFAPATVANVACGFDILGFALDEPGDEVVVRKKYAPGIVITSITGDDGRLTLDPQKNTVSIPVIKYLEKIQQTDLGFEIELHKKMPFGSGLGSSAASAVAGVYAVNKLLGEPLATEELLPFAMEGERIACGAAHADNVGPSLYGGFVLIRSYEPLDIIRLKVPKELTCAVIHPKIEVPTKDARGILKDEIPMGKAIKQWGNVGGLVAGLCMEDYALIGRSIKDEIVEPVRSILIPGYDQVKEAALKSGALGTGISGSGPSIFSLCRGMEAAEVTMKAKAKVFERLGIEYDAYISKVNLQGPKVLQEDLA